MFPEFTNVIVKATGERGYVVPNEDDSSKVHVELSIGELKTFEAEELEIDPSLSSTAILDQRALAEQLIENNKYLLNKSIIIEDLQVLVKNHLQILENRLMQLVNNRSVNSNAFIRVSENLKIWTGFLKNELNNFTDSLVDALNLPEHSHYTNEQLVIAREVYRHEAKLLILNYNRKITIGE
ncbi:hypothetical protein [Mucilaginibacter aquatilis]|uniref:Uncharacterized protein n=1 Tax=Mucilaginibacter aquatilis TaxID=1517760 RepID=A0A6I4IQP0_9SPHI|nr:hypothetical protein [Mucilaginibacter aquatilis]MVN92033.1 hypothetical protein [Mucilaginibacter aquatilis]